jgi:hypothetical protein
MQAKREGKESMVRLLLKHGADAKRADEEFDEDELEDALAQYEASF